LFVKPQLTFKISKKAFYLELFLTLSYNDDNLPADHKVSIDIETIRADFPILSRKSKWKKFSLF